MKIYTKFGDTGKTQLLGGQTVPKNDIRVTTCGTIDELNGVLGIVASQKINDELVEHVQRVQGQLFCIGAHIASVGVATRIELPLVNQEATELLENQIDQMDKSLEPLKNFILPGGSQASAQMHLARAICRRAERMLCELVGQHPKSELAEVTRYLNRLGDWCFVVARFMNADADVPDQIWTNQSSE